MNFMARMENAATTDRERDVINSARGIFAKFETQNIRNGGTAATGDAHIDNGLSNDYSYLPHNGTRFKHLSEEELKAQNADITAREAQWNTQVANMRRRAKRAENTLEEYAEIAPGEIDAWVENTLRPTIEEYLDRDDGKLVWTDDTKKKVMREKDFAGIYSSDMKRRQFDEDKKKYVEKLKAKKEAEAKKAKEAEEALKAKAEDDALMAETAALKAKDEEEKRKAAEEEANPKKKGIFSRVFGAAKDALLGKEAKLGGDLESVSDADLRACFESVFGNSDHLSDETVRVICLNALDRKHR
jgi:hypothetical protein